MRMPLHGYTLSVTHAVMFIYEQITLLKSRYFYQEMYAKFMF
jgi:hypothetical protein